ncbi:MAG: CHASE2 domain-containing protein [Cyanobacteria bacterium K_DeepCast_35m_m2_023]|nr:CHASE2 domain-containing protein [Cyanobacteria bacterium K_DeepCast_35m_m2_023]
MAARRRRIQQLLVRMAPYGIAALLLRGLELTQVLEGVNLLTYDLISEVRPAASGQDRPIVLIGISEGDITAYGWPIDDGLLCTAIDRLTADGATAIGLDLYRDKGVGPDQACLRQRIRRNPRLVSIFNVADAIGPIPGSPARQQGYNDLVLDVDGVVRRDLVHVGGQDESMVTLPMRLFEVSQGNAQLRQRLEALADRGSWLGADSGGYYSLDAAGYQQMLPFLQPGSFRTWSLQQLLAGQVPTAAIRHNVVLIGSTAPSLRDLFEVPHSRFRGGASQMLMPGVELHALRLAALQDMQWQPGQTQIWTASVQLTNAIVLSACLLGSLAAEQISPIRRGVLMVALLMLTWGGAAIGFLLQHVWLEMVEPLAALMIFGGTGLLRRGAIAQQQQRQVQRLLGQTTSPAVAQELWSQRDSLLSDGQFEGKLLPVTVVFADTASFTSVSERLAPASLLAWLNRGMGCCVPAITQHGGMVNKFTGDGFLGVFGAPLSGGSGRDARAAIAAALQLQQGMATLNETLTEEGQPAMRMRIGIHSGQVLAGSMGSSERLEYAVIGDTVNCASRLESLDKQHHDGAVRVLVSSATRHLLNEAASPEDHQWCQRLLWKAWGTLQVRGRQELLEIWELMGIAPAAAPANQESPRH